MKASTPIHAGRLKWLAAIQAPSVSRDSATGAQVTTWATVATVRVELIESATAGDETTAGGVAAYARPSQVRMRWRADMDPTRRLQIGGRLLQITGVAELGHRQGLMLACKAWAHQAP